MNHAKLIICLVAIVAIAPAMASTSAIQKQRSIYLDAKKHIRAGKVKSLDRIKRQLKGYPLLPYLEFDDLSRGLRNANKKQVSSFLTRHKDLAVANRLKSRWLYNQAKKKNWPVFLEFYDDTLANTELRCYYLRALIQTGKPKDVWPHVPSLWIVGKSQPKSCDPLFSQWISGGHINNEHKWQRLKIALQKGNTRLASYVSKMLKGSYKKSANKLLRVHRNPALVKKKTLFNTKNARDSEILIHGIRRLARTAPTEAARMLSRYTKSFKFMPDELTEAQKSIGFRILSHPSKKGLDWISKQLVKGVNQDVAVYAARISLLYNNWKILLKAIDFMPETLQQKERWQYWHAKASLALNPKLDEMWKHDAFGTLAVKRDFYGFLSARLLGQSFDFNDKTLTFGSDALSKVENTKGIIAALELYAADEPLNALREWHHALSQLPDTHMVVAAHIAEQWGWSNLAIQSTIKARAWDELKLRFPVSYVEYMKYGAKRGGIDLSWMYAIARQESAMNPSARSHAGAKGLMQLMPATAKATIQRNRLQIKNLDLLQEKQNSLVGGTHLGELIRYYDGNRALATAAYNAGKSRANSWLKRIDRTMPLDAWVETIPFKETRNYVQNVFMFASIYQYRLEQEPYFIKNSEWNIKP